jgi:hypothetical protein
MGVGVITSNSLKHRERMWPRGYSLAGIQLSGSVPSLVIIHQAKLSQAPSGVFCEGIIVFSESIGMSIVS